MIEGGLVIPLDDLLKTNGPDIANNISSTLDFSRKNWSQGQNKLYFLPAEVQAKPVSYYPDIGMGALIRWEFYKEIGAPEISSPDDLLNVLKQIVDKHSTTEDGKKIYGVSFWSDWGLWQYVFPMFWYKGERTDNSDFMVKQVGAKQYTNMLTDTNSTYWEALKYYYKAKQMGLLDPDALTMKSDDYSAKMTAGQYVSGIVTWAVGEFNNNNAKDGKGFVTIPNTEGFSFSGGVSPAGWVDKTYAITKSSKHPEKAMELLNYLYSYDGARTMHSGVEDVHWMMKDGKPQLTDEAIKLKSEGGDELYKTGIGLDANFIGLGEMVTHPGDGMQLNLFNTPEVYQKGMTALHKDFSDYYKVPYPGKIWEDRLEAGQLTDANTVLKGMTNEEILAENTIALPIVPDDMKKIEARLKDLGAKYAANVILSKNDAEFEENKNKAIVAFKDAGADQYTDWYTKAYAEARVAAGAK
ncbi:extracellular solute-binding protein [Paenibacillus yanchengensis]|uniref:Extracellular solute-binding protein n=1 Tax=Paenibacillus yanchengensis TaxID=2035833 RepID=A0ABW4YQR0_9BACL